MGNQGNSEARMEECPKKGCVGGNAPGWVKTPQQDWGCFCEFGVNKKRGGRVRGGAKKKANPKGKLMQVENIKKWCGGGGWGGGGQCKRIL